jgi:phage/plasmid-like protein (TIGR03299 family)
LKDGAVCLVTFLLDEPVRISGDDSEILPYGVARWTHDGSGSLRVRSTSVRVVCANTDEASAMQAKRLGTEYSFRHTKNVKQKIEDAKLAIRGIRDDFADFVRLSEELADVKVTPQQRELFVCQLLPMPPEALISERVVENVETARRAVRNLFNGPTIPDAHKLSAYGLRLAGVEYLDHLRGYRNNDTYVGRQLLRTEPAKAKLTSLIREVVKA